MLRGFVANISSDGEKVTATIILENKECYVVPIEMLPKNIQEDDFVLIDNGIISIDPNTDDYGELIFKELKNYLK